jgi:hypothetical protein
MAFAWINTKTSVELAGLRVDVGIQDIQSTKNRHQVILRFK